MQAGKDFFLSSFNGKIAKYKIQNKEILLEILDTNGKYATVFIFLSFVRIENLIDTCDEKFLTIQRIIRGVTLIGVVRLV